MVRRFTLAALAAATLIGATVPADAGVTVLIKDKTGDANAVNGQGFLGAPVPQDFESPGSHPGLDIASLKISSTFARRTPVALVITLQFAGKPDETSTVHRVTADKAGECGTFLVQYYTGPLGKRSALRTCDKSQPLGYRDIDLPMPKVTATAIAWSIPYKALGALGLKPGVTLEGLGAHNRLRHAATVPQVDAVSSTQKYKLGS